VWLFAPLMHTFASRARVAQRRAHSAPPLRQTLLTTPL